MTRRQAMTVRIARWSALHPWRAMALWVVFVAASVVAGGAAGTRSATAADHWVGESGRASAIIQSSGLEPPAVESVLISRPLGTLAPDAPVVAPLEEDVTPIRRVTGTPYRQRSSVSWARGSGSDQSQT
jgi:putative drug exporter of the RND superfamily